MQGGEHRITAQALRDGDLTDAPLTSEERLLLGFVRTVTIAAHQVTDEQVQDLRDSGWSDAQIAEAVYVAAYFALCTRLADAFNIEPPEFMDRVGRPAVLDESRPFGRAFPDSEVT